MRKLIVIAVVVFGLLGIGAVAWASIPGPDGVIHACYKTSNPAQGALIAIDSAASCPSGYAALNWNQTGPQGPVGISGYEVVSQTITAEGQAVAVVAACPTGKRLLGGGGGSGEADNGNNTNYNMVLTESRPMYPPDVDGWYVKLQAVNGAQGSFRLTAFAICANVV